MSDRWTISNPVTFESETPPPMTTAPMRQVIRGPVTDGEVEVMPVTEHLAALEAEREGLGERLLGDEVVELIAKRRAPGVQKKSIVGRGVRDAIRGDMQAALDQGSKHG